MGLPDSSAALPIGITRDETLTIMAMNPIVDCSAGAEVTLFLGFVCLGGEANVQRGAKGRTVGASRLA